MPRVRLFAGAREAAGTAKAVLAGNTVGEVLDAAAARWGAELSALLPRCAVWVNGEPANRDAPVHPDDELAVLPPVSGG